MSSLAIAKLAQYAPRFIDFFRFELISPLSGVASKKHKITPTTKPTPLPHSPDREGENNNSGGGGGGRVRDKGGGEGGVKDGDVDKGGGEGGFGGGGGK